MYLNSIFFVLVSVEMAELPEMLSNSIEPNRSEEQLNEDKRTARKRAR